MHQSHWGRAGLARTSYGHAMAVRVPCGMNPETIAAALDTASRCWWDPGARPTRLWVENVRAGSGSEEACRRLDAEVHRPVAVDGPVIRAVLVQYADAVADLVVAADRRDLDPGALAVVCDVLLGAVDADTVTAKPIRRHADGRALLAYARRRRIARPRRTSEGRPLHTGVPLERGDGDVTTDVAVAAAVVTARYDGLDSVTVPVWATYRSRPRNVLGGSEKCVCLSIDTSRARASRDLLDEADGVLHQEDRRRPLDIAEACHPAGRAATQVGVLGTVLYDPARTYLPCQSAPFPITLLPVVGTDGQATLEVYADPAAVDEHVAARFGRQVAQVVHSFHGPTTGARQRMPSAFTDEDASSVGVGVRAAAATLGSRIEDVFAMRARARPDAVAVTHGRRTVTYSELDEQSRWVARALRERGVAPGDRVGICLDRSIDLIVTMLAVLRVGAAFVPMDVRHPPDRLAYTASDARVRLVVTDIDARGWGESASAVTLQELEMSAFPATDVAVGVSAAPAYVIYTSGSTGRPKGIAVPHGAVLTLLAATADEFALGSDDVWSMFHSPAFDFSVWEIWGALLTGARLVIVPYWISRSPVEFHTLLAEEHVTVLSQTPSAFVPLVAADQDLAPLDSLRLVVFGGETLEPRVVLPWLDRYPESSCRLVNMYGTTESTVHATAHTVTRRDALTDSKTVGKPLPGWEIQVTDEYGRPLPGGMAGEIYIGGVGVSLGYLNRPAMTAGRFVAALGGRRRYRTGDRGRMRDDGALEHLGRLDAQVQIRGFRVELGEVRAVLLDDPAVTAAAVVPSGRPDDPSGLAIDAYVVLTKEDSTTVPMLRRRAARFLPDHMVPRTITVVDALPLTVNGKLDVTRLPEPTPPARRPSVRAPNEVPEISEARSTEASLVDIWESVLGVAVSPDDNLFELGGNSLCAIKADNMMRRLGLPALPMRELYRHPSIRGICDTLARLYPPRPDT
ncbi:amino acid adenylation domain-containing protein [Rhodococcus koreensis]